MLNCIEENETCYHIHIGENETYILCLCPLLTSNMLSKFAESEGQKSWVVIIISHLILTYFCRHWPLSSDIDLFLRSYSVASQRHAGQWSDGPSSGNPMNYWYQFKGLHYNDTSFKSLISANIINLRSIFKYNVMIKIQSILTRKCSENCVYDSEKHKHIFTIYFFVISQHTSGTGSWNILS